MLKQNELRNPNSCLNKAASDEPIFVLRAKDPLFAQTIQLWAAMADNGMHEEEKVREARELAAEGLKWFQDRQTAGAQQDDYAIGGAASSVNRCFTAEDIRLQAAIEQKHLAEIERKRCAANQVNQQQRQR